MPSAISADSARNYINNSRLDWLFEKMAAAVMSQQPAHPRRFLLEQLEQLQQFRRSETEQLPLLVFDSRNVKALFNVLDIGSRGSITMEQYHEAMRDIGLSSAEYNHHPVQDLHGGVSADTLVSEADAALRKVFRQKYQ